MLKECMRVSVLCTSCIAQFHVPGTPYLYYTVPVIWVTSPKSTLPLLRDDINVEILIYLLEEKPLYYSRNHAFFPIIVVKKAHLYEGEKEFLFPVQQ